ncbi:MAG TPA: hypothetical protein VNJ46_03650 [Gaiellaceae bacterium]|nr:hypothetical protein [Gaiellaceae bacterium]
MGTLLLALGVLGIGGSAALLAASLRLSAALPYVLATYLLALGELVGASLLLSLWNGLTLGALLAATALLVLASGLVWSRCGRPAPPLQGVAAALRDVAGDRVVASLGALVALAYAYLVAGTLTVPQSAWDALLYHLPRAALWRQQQAVGYVDGAVDERIGAMPPVAEIEALASMLLAGSDRYVGLVQIAAVACSGLAVAGLARRLGLGRRPAAFGALVFSALPLVVLQAPTALNDLAVAALLLAAAYFLLGERRAELGLGGLALALALATKLTTVFALPVLAVLVLVLRRERVRPRLVAGAGGLAAGSFWYVLNLFETGRPDGGLAEAFPQSAALSPAATLERVGFLALDLAELASAEGSGVLLRSPLAGLAVGLLLASASAVLALRGRRDAAAWVFLAAAFTLLAAPLVQTWAELGWRAAQRAAAAAGVAGPPGGSRLPDGLYEGPVSSGYGPTFVLLVLGVGVVLALGAAPPSVRRGAWAALAGVPLFLVLFALVVEYDPLRMRFAAFPVGLACASAGIVLRVRPLAWTAVGLTAASLAVALGYFAPRPGGTALVAQRDRDARWLVQAESGVVLADARVFRFLEESMPEQTTLALAVRRDTPLYPAWNAGLDRRVVFAPDAARVPEEAEWLLVGPGVPADLSALRRPGWSLALATPGGWRILRR